jgi:hypothetical protein
VQRGLKFPILRLLFSHYPLNTTENPASDR